VSFWQPFLKPAQTLILWRLLEGEELTPADAEERERLREWFEQEVNANQRKPGAELTGARE
jgi:hypothetical protein